MGCLSSSLTRVGGGMTCNMSRQGGMSIRFGLVCGTDIGAYEYFCVEEGYLITADDKYFLVRQKEL